jgi:hypothetical protein
MSTQIVRAANIPEFLRVVTDLTAPWFREKTWGPWFRGQRDATWNLVPSLYRVDPPARGIRVLEDEIRQEFEVRAPSLTDERPRNLWEWYFLMQHSGAPTRLLDWTEGSLIALYFAVKNKRDEISDAAVWVLDPWEMNRAVLGRAEVIAPGADAGMLKADAEYYKPWLPARYENPGALGVELPAAVYPTHFARRISSQRSCFTIHGSSRDGFERLPKPAKARLVKIVVPAHAAREIDRELSIAGVDEVAIFPDLDGLGRWLAMVLRDESGS